MTHASRPTVSPFAGPYIALQDEAARRIEPDAPPSLNPARPLSDAEDGGQPTMIVRLAHIAAAAENELFGHPSPKTAQDRCGRGVDL